MQARSDQGVGRGLSSRTETGQLGITDRDITVSVGVSMRDGQQSIAEMHLHADQNLYQAKSLGRNRVVGINETGESPASTAVVRSHVALSNQCKDEAADRGSVVQFRSPSKRSEQKPHS